MAAWTATARQVANMARLSSLKSAASLVHRRGLAGGADHHGPPKVNFWEAPLSPSKWKQNHFVIASLAGCGLLFYGGYKFYTGDKNDKKDNMDNKDNKSEFQKYHASFWTCS
ncbi:hypothetical protein M0R45_014988 [Rubus argutus]|uniref:Uncharacterized protein n=1 Tax=Rubus argutus TaxID=59490 RepID=A0AAW1XMW9_RUBAR